MELLINRIMRLGGEKKNLRAKAFGGAKMLALRAGPIDVATQNSEFILEFLLGERIPVDAYRLGGTSAVTVRFEPMTGKAHIRSVPRSEGQEIVSTEELCQIRVYRAVSRLKDQSVTLFQDL
jgi:chemotaxis protein CheD